MLYWSDPPPLPPYYGPPAPSVSNCCYHMLSILLQQPIKFCSLLLYSEEILPVDKGGDRISLWRAETLLTHFDSLIWFILLWTCETTGYTFPSLDQRQPRRRRRRRRAALNNNSRNYGIPSLSSVCMTGTAWQGWHIVAARNTLQWKWQRGEMTTEEAERQRAEAKTFFITEGNAGSSPHYPADRKSVV